MADYHRYSHHVRRSLAHAATLADGFQHAYQDTAHLLVGVMLAKGSIGATVMQELAVPVEVAGVHLKHLMPRDEDHQPPVPRSRDFEKALEYAGDEAAWLGSHYIGTEHLLLGITRANHGNAIELLRLVLIPPERIRRLIRQQAHDNTPVQFSLKHVRASARLSELSRRVLNAAEQQATLLEHAQPGIGHLLLALAQERRGSTAQFLRQSGLKEATLETALERKDTALLLPLEPILEDAVIRAEMLGSHYVGADHLLLALTGCEQGITLLQTFRVDKDRVVRLLNKLLDGG